VQNLLSGELSRAVDFREKQRQQPDFPVRLSRLGMDEPLRIALDALACGPGRLADVAAIR